MPLVIQRLNLSLVSMVEIVFELASFDRDHLLGNEDWLPADNRDNYAVVSIDHSPHIPLLFIFSFIYYAGFTWEFQRFHRAMLGGRSIVGEDSVAIILWPSKTPAELKSTAHKVFRAYTLVGKWTKMLKNSQWL